MDQGPGVKVPPGPHFGPEPGGRRHSGRILPLGVGAVYTGQYAKGLAHW